MASRVVTLIGGRVWKHTFFCLVYIILPGDRKLCSTFSFSPHVQAIMRLCSWCNKNDKILKHEKLRNKEEWPPLKWSKW